MTDDTNYMNVITRNASYEITTINNLTKVYNFSNSEDTYILPLSTYQKLNYSNDVVMIGNDIIKIFQVNTNRVSCGDGVCNAFENALTCAVDCFNIPDGSDTVDFRTLELYDNCVSDDNCISGFCDLSKCSLKGTGQFCNENTECLSNKCVLNKCNSAGFFAKLNQIKNVTVGEDENDGVVLFIIIAGVLIISGGVFTFMRGSVIPLLAGVILTLIFFVAFTLFGWLPAWFIVIAFILLAIASVIMFLIFKK